MSPAQALNDRGAQGEPLWVSSSAKYVMESFLACNRLACLVGHAANVSAASRMLAGDLLQKKIFQCARFSVATAD
jgi:hypothetical protein